MRTTRRILLLAGLAAGVLGWQAPARAETTIPIIVKDTTSQYWQIVLAGARKAAQELGIKVPELGAQSESDINGQITALENAVSEHPAAIVIAPTQFAALGPPITAAAKEVKIIGIDSGADTKSFTSFLTTDNVKGGEMAGEALAEAIKQKTGKDAGDVALITALPGVGSLDQRAEGFKRALAHHPGLKLVASRIADGQATTGLNIMSDLLTANPNLVGVFASHLYMIQGASQALAEAGKADKVALVGFDSDKNLVNFLRTGVIYALVVQDPYRMGHDGIAIALKASKGEEVPKLIDTGVTVITKANLDSPRAQELLNPKLQ